MTSVILRTPSEARGTKDLEMRDLCISRSFASLKMTVIIALLLAAAVSLQAQDRWYKGNTHTHTLNSDGDSTPDEVVRWYREHKYHFVVLTDHNFLTKVDALNALHGADEQFLIIKGEEVTDRFEKKPIHVNGLDVEKWIEPQGGTSVVDVVQRNVNAVRGAKGVPHINHPNFGWAISGDELKQIENDKLFEIFNGHPLVNNQGGGGVPGLEEVWDSILTSGKLIYGIAVDDAHHFKRPWDPEASKPGQGWVVVRAEKLEARAILAALERGDFYASTGVALDDYRVDGKSMTVSIRASALTKFTTLFIGRGGAVLAKSGENPAGYSFRGDEGYVRAKVIDSNGKVAWCQPVVVK
ncbi:MAG TPA: CehA/McbA family metallohydrolase [Thermoanaerobaculia bacterium]